MRRLFHCKEGLNETLRYGSRARLAQSCNAHDYTSLLDRSFLQNAFELLDKPLYKHLMGLSPPLTPTFYSLPWLLTLFSQVVTSNELSLRYSVTIAGLTVPFCFLMMFAGRFVARCATDVGRVPHPRRTK